MLGRKNTAFKGDLGTFIGANAVFEGNIELGGTIRVDGKIIGNLNIDGDAFIGSDALVKGNIRAKNVHLAGTVEGNIRADGILKILSTAKLYGDIEVKSFVTDEGAIFEGKCSMILPPPELPEIKDIPGPDEIPDINEIFTEDIKPAGGKKHGDKHEKHHKKNHN
jgi:cytoskeletal protein CcmA (bactofilin family)